jgi:hypothetical protein
MNRFLGISCHVFHDTQCWNVNYKDLIMKSLIQNNVFFVVLKDFVIMEPTRLVHASNCLEMWGKELHMEEEVVANQLELIKYRCLCTCYCEGGRLVPRSTIRDHFRRFGCHYFCSTHIVEGIFDCSTWKPFL